MYVPECANQGTDDRLWPDMNNTRLEVNTQPSSCAAQHWRTAQILACTKTKPVQCPTLLPRRTQTSIAHMQTHENDSKCAPENLQSTIAIRTPAALYLRHANRTRVGQSQQRMLSRGAKTLPGGPAATRHQVPAIRPGHRMRNCHRQACFMRGPLAFQGNARGSLLSTHHSVSCSVKPPQHRAISVF